jgi:hypothetical protein
VDAELHQSTWDTEILYVDRSSEYEQPLMRPLLRETKTGTWLAVEIENSHCFS